MTWNADGTIDELASAAKVILKIISLKLTI